MNILIAGGSGFIGRTVARHFLAAGHTVTILSRRHPGGLPGGIRWATWDGVSQGSWADEVASADLVVNLAGESLASGRWTAARKARIVGSRVGPTRALVTAMRESQRGPSVLLNASGTGYYGVDPEGEIDETKEAGTDFIAVTCRQWEAEALQARSSDVRVVLLRTAVVLGAGSEALRRMTLLFRLFIGGPLGSGRQWIPWIHATDVAQAMLFIAGNTAIEGPVNLVAPQAVTMDEFSRTLGSVMHRPSWLRVPAPVLHGVLGEQAAVVTGGQHCIPRILERYGYPFRFPRLREALEDALRTPKGVTL